MPLAGFSGTTWIAASAVATAALAFATAAVAWVTIRQLPILRSDNREAMRSADAALRVAGAAEATLGESRRAWREQSIAATYPVLDVSAVAAGNAVKLTIANRGSNPALDLDLLAFLEYTEVETPFEEFLHREVSADSRHLWAGQRLDREAVWALRERLLYTAIPPGRRVEVALAAPETCKTFHLLLQYRDVFGRNYGRLDWFTVDDRGRFRLAGSVPPCAALTPRLDARLKIEGRGEQGSVSAELEAALDRNIRAIESQIIPLGVLRGVDLDMEDRGDWSDA